MTYALTAYSHQSKPAKVLDMVRSLVSAPWPTLHPLVKHLRRFSNEYKMIRGKSFTGQTEDNESLEQVQSGT